MVRTLAMTVRRIAPRGMLSCGTGAAGALLVALAVGQSAPTQAADGAAPPGARSSSAGQAPLRASETTVPAASDALSDAFARAQARGALIVGVPFVAPEAVAGAKIRTPERLDTVMAQRLGQQLGLPVRVVQVASDQGASALDTGEVDVLIADGEADRSGSTRAIATGYRARPKAIIRSDTSMRSWDDVDGRTVCMSSAAFQAQALATHWGATVRTYPVPSDALVAVREGGCDVGLVDDAAWTPLMKFPEWQKFSATLNDAGPPVERVWRVDGDDRGTQAWLEHAMTQWRKEGVIQRMVEKWARDVAFDVYLDQEVPDCHG